MISGRRVDSTSNSVKIITSNINSKRTTSPLPPSSRLEQSSTLPALTQQEHALLLAPPLHVSKANETIEQCRTAEGKTGKGDGVENKQKTSNLLHKDATVVNEVKGKTAQKVNIHDKQIKAKQKLPLKNEASIKSVAASIAKNSNKQTAQTKKQQSSVSKPQEKQKIEQQRDRESESKGTNMLKQQEIVEYQQEEFQEEVQRMTLPVPIAAPAPQAIALEQVSFQNMHPAFPTCPINYQSSDQEQSNLLENEYSFLPVQMVTEPDEESLQLNMDLFSLSADQLMALDYIHL